MKKNITSDQYKTLLESTKAIPWKIDWETQTFTYIGPQIEGILGWPQDSWKTAKDWASRMHPEDREFTVNYCITQSDNGIDHEADYRALTKDGGYVWIRDVVHVIRKNGKVESLVGFMLDITERKKIAQEKKELIDSLQKALNEIKTLKGIIPICSYCHKIRNEEGAWDQMEEYISNHSGVEFSHGVCPKCIPELRRGFGLSNDKE